MEQFFYISRAHIPELHANMRRDSGTIPFRGVLSRRPFSMLKRPVSRLNCRESRVDRNCPVFENERMRFQSRVTKSFGSLSFRCKVDVKACRCCDISATTIHACAHHLT